MKAIDFVLALVLVVTLLSGCSAASATTPAVSDTSSEGQVADRFGDGGLVAVAQLALGMFHLEASDQAVTPAQAAELLPLWQMIQGGALQGGAETHAVIKQVESKMTKAHSEHRNYN